jgi:pyruvate/2-oxoglutarate dehydrogenase complex dihydrolipoamide dehydrogenase (E3) component
MAQSFARFGSKVTLIEKSDSILSREDRDAAKIVQDSMIADGVHIAFFATTTGMTQSPDGTTVSFRQHGKERSVIVDKVLVGIGRNPNVNGIGLEDVGVRFDSRSGVEVNDRLQTTNPRIYAAGDVCSKYKFTHSADFTARIVIQNTLFLGRAKASALTIPWCTYTSPELAHVGIQPKEAADHGMETDTYSVPFSDVDRSILSGETEGFVKAHVRKGTDEIVGATIVAPHAGDMIGEVTLAMTLNASVPKWKRLLRLQKGVGLSALGSTIHPYPTEAEAIRKLGDQYNRTRLTPFVKRLFEAWLRWTR